MPDLLRQPKYRQSSVYYLEEIILTIYQKLQYGFSFETLIDAYLPGISGLQMQIVINGIHLMKDLFAEEMPAPSTMPQKNNKMQMQFEGA